MVGTSLPSSPLCGMSPAVRVALQVTLVHYSFCELSRREWLKFRQQITVDILVLKSSGFVKYQRQADQHSSQVKK